jgi:monoamine oxidase
VRPELTLAEGPAPLLTVWADDPWAKMAYSAEGTAAQPEDAALLQRAVGRVHFAGEHTAGEWAALMEGALRSGQRAATEVLRAA